LGVAGQRYSPGLEKEMVRLSGEEKSLVHAEEVIERVGHLSISDSSIWRRKERWGARFLEVEEAERERANVLGSAEAFQACVRGSKQRLGVSMDGTMVHLRKEGWKELKVGCCFEIEVYPTRHKATSDWEDLAHARHSQYIAHLGGPEVFGQKVWALAKGRGWEEALAGQVLGDGAPWVWNLAEEHFYDAQQTVDWYHATQHVSHTAILLYGEDTSRTTHWRNTAYTRLYQGHAEQIAQEVTQAAADYPQAVAEEGYLETNKRRMQYQEVRENGYLIGSGMVESGGKQYKARFCGPGMRWSRVGIERLIPIRSAVMSNSFDSAWQAARNSPPF
jgi:hypothetical protein